MNGSKKISPIGNGVPTREKIKSDHTEIITDHSENINSILEKLTELLQMTRAGKNIESIEQAAEYAIIRYKDWHEVDVHIGGDSGIAAIYDIVRKLM